MDFKNLRIPGTLKSGLVDPLSIFDSAVQRGQIETLRGAQQEALKKWHADARDRSDVLFSLDTGGGKSLVGLLAAQSLCNETRQPIVYMCPTVQLVEQIESQAVDAGLKVDKYLNGVHSQEPAFAGGDIPCVTTYHAVFNGYSHFRRFKIAGAIFDDAHVAEGIVRSCFTIRAIQGTPQFVGLAAVCNSYFETTPFASECRRRLLGQAAVNDCPLLLPAFETRQNASTIQSILSNAREDDDVRFALGHLEDHIAQCLVLIGNGKIEVTPWILPVSVTPPFRENARRLYLSATLPSIRSFVRAFGTAPKEVIEPEGKTNAAQRVFIQPTGATIAERREAALSFLDDRRVAVLVPSHPAARAWEKIGLVLPTGSGKKVLTAFRADKRGRLVLVARYDGIDLPGDDCHALIVEGLPRGEQLLESYFAVVLQLQDERERRIADRLTQGLGRIFRSNRDHGVVVLTDPSVESWLRSRANRSLLPSLLQRQLLMSFHLQKEVGDSSSVDDWKNTVAKIVGGDEDWDSFYRRSMEEISADDVEESADRFQDVVALESEVGTCLWNHHYDNAISKIEILQTKHKDLLSEGHKGFLWHMAGLAHLMNGSEDSARETFEEARRLVPRFGRSTDSIGREFNSDIRPSRQATACANRLGDNWRKQLQNILRDLRGEGGNQGEEHVSALVRLGSLLGLTSTPADDESGGQGPDVYWGSPDEQLALSIEAKTQKSNKGQYSKLDIGQSASSMQWARDQVGEDGEVVPIIVGPEIPLVQQASPPSELRIVPIESMVDVTMRLLTVFEAADKRPAAISAAVAVEQVLREEGLLLDRLVRNIQGVWAKDLRK